MSPDASGRDSSSDRSAGYPRRVRWVYGCGLVACAVAVAISVAPSASARKSRYCEKPSGPGAFLAASRGVTCATAEKVRSRLISPSCYTRNRCVVGAFRCVAYWDGRFDLTFEDSSHALCNDRWRWIVWDGG
jgi:hypothetical protein